MSDFTPGPWHASSAGVTAMNVAGANVVCEAPIHYLDSAKNWEANARLIAAAPELLAALRNLHHTCEIALSGKEGQQHVYFETRKGHFVKADDAMREAETAIAKAEGRT